MKMSWLRLVITGSLLYFRNMAMARGETWQQNRFLCTVHTYCILGNHLGLLTSSEARVAGEDHGEVLEDQAEDLGAVAEVGGHVDQPVHQGRQQRHQQLPRGL